MRHLVAMRFLSIKRNDVQDLTLKSAEHYADIFARYTLKSLQNMSNKRFDTVFMVSDSADLRLLAPLVPYAAELGASFVKYDDFNRFVERYRETGDRMIVTRCDADDLFGKWLIDEVQTFAEKTSTTSIFGYQSSLLYREGTQVLRAYPIDYAKGHWSAFQSLIYSKDDRLKNVTPYSWKHPNFFEFLSRRGFSTEELTKMHVNGDSSRLPYVWIRHGSNVSTDTVETDKRYQEIHDITPDTLKNNYGVRLDIA